MSSRSNARFWIDMFDVAEQVRRDQRVEAHAAHRDAVVRQHEEVEVAVVRDLLQRRVFEQRPQRVEHDPASGELLRIAELGSWPTGMYAASPGAVAIAMPTSRPRMPFASVFSTWRPMRPAVFAAFTSACEILLRRDRAIRGVGRWRRCGHPMRARRRRRHRAERLPAGG